MPRISVFCLISLYEIIVKISCFVNFRSIVTLVIALFYMNPLPVQADSEHKDWLPGVEDLNAIILLTQGEIYYKAEGSSKNLPENEVSNLPVEPHSPDEAVGEALVKGAADKIQADKAEKGEHYLKALELMRQHKLKEAERELLLHVKDFSGHSQGWRQLGDCRYNLGQPRKALGAYRIALRADRTNYLALRGKGVASLYIGYELWEKGKGREAHEYFKTALQSLHSCSQLEADDELASYARALAAEGVSRELYRIASESLNSEYHTQAKRVIRNCLEIIDAAITATTKRLEVRPDDVDAKMLLGGLYLRRARLLQPFGHIEEALGNVRDAQKYFGMVATAKGKRQGSAREQVDICKALKDEWKH